MRRRRRQEAQPCVEDVRRHDLAGMDEHVAQRVRDGNDKAIGALVANQDPTRFRAIAVKVPGIGETDRVVAMRDLAVLTGAQAIMKDLHPALVKLMRSSKIQRAGRCSRTTVSVSPKHSS